MAEPESNAYGILALEVYLPKLYINQSEFEEVKGVPKGKIQIGLGQEEMSFVSHLEDVNSMALTVLSNLLERTKVPIKDIGKLEFATETLHDKSKSSKTILMQLLGDHKDVEGVTHLNACYGGTAALFDCISWGQSEGRNRLSIVVMADVAVYNTIAAQPTGGAGAIAILLGPNPSVVIEPLRASHFSDVYDFYKPNLASEFPTVDGRLSTDVYLDSLIQSLEQLKKKYSDTGKKFAVEDLDFFLFHCPFSKQVEKAFLKVMYEEIMKGNYLPQNLSEVNKLLGNKPDFNDRVTQKNLRDLVLNQEILEKLCPGLNLNRKVGNIYTGSLYLSLASIIYNNDDSLNNKRVFLYSYGSGSAATVFTARFTASFSSEKFLNKRYLLHIMQQRTKVEIGKFEALNHRREVLYTAKGFKNEAVNEYLWDNSYYLKEVDKLGRRSYQFHEGQANQRITNISNALVKNDKFRHWSIDKRQYFISEKTGQMSHELLNSGGLDINTANNMVENCIGLLGMPLGVGLNFKVNGIEKIVPMVIEEPSVIAAASNTAKLICENSPGFKSTSSRNVIRGQIFIQNCGEKDIDGALKKAKKELISYANENLCSHMVNIGGGVIDIITAGIDSQTTALHVLVDVQDSMGANTVNTVLEGLKPSVEKLLKGKVLMCIISNLAPERIVHTYFEIPVEALAYDNLSGLEVAKKLIEANEIAKKDLFRASTHNKGIMNGVNAVCLAIGQDIRSIEASCHVYTIHKHGHYRALTEYTLIDNNTRLRGELEIPFTMGTKGGATTSNPLYAYNMKIMGSPDTRELAGIVSSVGLAQNLAALRALVTNGIQKGHMKLHARNVAMSVGITPDAIQKAVDYMISKNSITQDTANEFLEKFK